jgi:uncharacterized protein YaiI (UPF0178 family)
MKNKFIVTQDNKTAELLLASGFKLVVQNGATYTFLNEAPKGFNFANFDKSKIAYTNIMTI